MLGRVGTLSKCSNSSIAWYGIAHVMYRPCIAITWIKNAMRAVVHSMAWLVTANASMSAQLVQAREQDTKHLGPSQQELTLLAS